MSNVYILEPPTSGKVLLKTTVGDIDVELWAKETPKTCRNFIQLCIEGYYDSTIFHRVVKGFIVQGGDPIGDGTGGESIYYGPFADEFHQRLKFTRRGLLGMANAGEHDNGSQFFFTLGATPELQNKHTIFGKVVGDTIYNMLKLEEGLIERERPAYPHKILKTEVLQNPFSDIVPRIKEIHVKVEKKKESSAGVKNYKLLSFGDEAEEDEEETERENEKFGKKGKSTHDVLDDPKLSSKTELNDEDENRENQDSDCEDNEDHELQLDNIRKKLKSENMKRNLSTNYFLQRDNDEKRKKVESIQKEIEEVKRDYHKNKLKREDEEKVEVRQEAERTEVFKEYKEQYDKYKDKKACLPKKGAGREEHTLQLLSKFKNKLHKAKEDRADVDNTAVDVEMHAKGDKEDEDDDDDGSKWLSHELHFKDDAPTLAKDANTKDDDWFEIYDPRNKLNKRRRGDVTKRSRRT